MPVRALTIAPVLPRPARLAGAIGVSVVLHALLLVGVPALPPGKLSESLTLFEANAAPLQASLTMPERTEPAPERHASRANPGFLRLAAAPAAKPGAAPVTAPLRPADYLPTSKVDVRPGIMTRVEPEYPERAARRFLSGKVRIRLFISERGTVDRVVVVKAEPPGFFEDSAERAFAAARFSPAMKDGRAVKVQMLLEVDYESPPAPKIPGGRS